jgi:hypothetical protein
VVRVVRDPEEPGRDASVVNMVTRKPESVYGIGGQTARFKVHPVAKYYDAIQSQRGSGAAPGNELMDGVFVDAAQSRKSFLAGDFSLRRPKQKISLTLRSANVQ